VLTVFNLSRVAVVSLGMMYLLGILQQLIEEQFVSAN
jgi:hypothetical protein